MALKLIMVRRGQMLAAADPYSLEEVQKLTQGEIVSITLTRPRNLAHHRKFWKLMQMIFETQDFYTDIEDMMDDIKIGIGHSRQKVTRHGEVFTIPKSISFAAMDQSAFEKFYERVIAFVLRDILPNIGRPEFDAHFYSILDGRDYTELMR